MKRKKELITLSWEHHDGLVFAFRLQQGVKKSAPLKDMREYILHTWDTALDHHFWQEEQSLNPVLQASGAGRELLNHMLDDHEYFRREIEHFRVTKNPDRDRIKTISEKLNQHIRFEEQILFPFLEEEIALATLQKIGVFLNEHHTKPDRCWTSMFWK
ncbi:MAG TPA: hemerythrin domain-containing protein [Caldithrix sp.]|nr:hemerythrin domain-containing protein [Calditrichaceae bacterium]HEM48988.1 hemerythrin domain-containing protein [Caldithrix sp.]HES59685.1 hemerythrin domain-containing protein [Caldithrix sp.]